MILMLNLMLELTSLWSTWHLRHRGLRVFLGWLVIFDLGWMLVARTSHGHLPWYYYWLGRSLSLLLQGWVAEENIPKFRWSRWGRDLWVFTLGFCLIIIILYTWVVIHPAYRAQLLGLNIICSLIIGMMLSLTFVYQVKNRSIRLGSLLWVLITIITSLDLGWYESFYPILSLAPLLVWSWSLMGRIGYGSINRGSREKINPGRNRAGILQGAAQGGMYSGGGS